METLFAILLIIAGASIVYYLYVKPSNQNYEPETFELTSEQIFKADGSEIKEPLTNADFVKGISYIDNQNKKRHDEKMYILGKIKFWLTIIGIYVLIKLITTIIIIFTEGATVLTIINALQKLF